MRRNWCILLFLYATWVVWAGPVDFGKQEFDRAIAERNLAARRIRIQTEVSGDAPESYRIQGTRVSGGDLRGLLYGLLEATDQIRTSGRLTAAKGAPAVRTRGIRLPIGMEELIGESHASPAQWDELFATMAKTRLNRLNLYLKDGVVITERVRGFLRTVSESASGFAIDLALSLNPESLPSGPEEVRPILSDCPQVRAVSLRTGTAGASKRDAVVRGVADAGRLVVLEVPQAEVTPGLLGEIADTGVVWRRVAVQGGAPSAAVPEGEEVLTDLGALRSSRQEASDNLAGIGEQVKVLAQPGSAGFEIEIETLSDVSLPALQLWGRTSYDPAYQREPVKRAPATKK